MLGGRLGKRFGVAAPESTVLRGGCVGLLGLWVAFLMCTAGSVHAGLVLVQPGDDLSVAVASANAGDTLFLVRADEAVGTQYYYPSSPLVIDKDLTVRGSTMAYPHETEIQRPWCTGNVIANSGFEAGVSGGEWSIATVQEGGGIITADAMEARTGYWMARFAGISLLTDTQQLSQSIVMNENITTLTFFLWIKQQSNTGEDVFRVYMDGTLLEEVADTTAGYASGYAQMAVDVSAYADGGTHMLRFESIKTGAGLPSVFLVDDVCLQGSGAASQAVFTVRNGATLVLDNLSLAEGAHAVRVEPNGSVQITRCYMHDIQGTALYLDQVTSAVVANSIIADCASDAVYTSGGVVNIYQSTILDNMGYAISANGGEVNVIASLFYDNVGGFYSTTTCNSYSNFIYPESNVGATMVGTAFTHPDASLVVFEEDSLWRGNLSQRIRPIPNVYMSDLPESLQTEMTAMGRADYEGNTRVVNLQIGADEEAEGSVFSGRLVCRLVDADTGTPIETGAVLLTPGSIPAVTQNTDGAYTFNFIPSGPYSVSVSASGYITVMRSIEVGAGVETEELFEMTSSSNELRLVQQPKSASIYVGQSHTLQVGATGGVAALTYTWKKDGTALGAPSQATYAITDAALSDSGVYTCEVSDGVTTLTTSSASVSVVEPSATGYHSADLDQNWVLSLSELLRMIQLFNSGEFHCEAGTEDGFAVGNGTHACTPHKGDYNPNDWAVSLSELLRMVQFFNSSGGAYHVAADTEDGFAPGASKL